MYHVNFLLGVDFTNQFICVNQMLNQSEFATSCSSKRGKETNSHLFLIARLHKWLVLTCYVCVFFALISFALACKFLTNSIAFHGSVGSKCVRVRENT